MSDKKTTDEIRPRLTGAKRVNFEFFNNKERRVLVIGDLHAPFDLDGYFDHCVEIYERYNCTDVVFIGDVIDNHYSSYHEADANGMGGAEELELAINRLKRWYHRFPVATVIIGNHDRIIMRKAQSSAVPSKWIKEYKEVLETPGWTFTESLEIDNVLYVHGEGGTARTRCKLDMQSVVQGHLHTQAYVEYQVGRKSRVFGMQVGCGINHETYAMAYAKAGKKPAIACGVVLGGKTGIVELMNL